MIKRIIVLCGIAFLASTLSARADELFVGSQAGLCCFNVDLHQVNANEMEVTATLIDGAQWFVDTGSGQHPGFAFGLNGDPAITITNISSPWGPTDVHLAPVTTGGPGMGTFDYFFDNPGPGGSAHNDGPLVFDINLAGITYSSFVKSSGEDGGYYFAADIGNIHNCTGMSGISSDPTPPPVPEPSSLLMLGTGFLCAVGMVRRRMMAGVARC